MVPSVPGLARAGEPLLSIGVGSHFSHHHLTIWKAHIRKVRDRLRLTRHDVPHDVIATCPVCSNELSVTRLRCGDCATVIEGDFGVGRFARLNREQTQVLESFLRSRGNLRDMERELGISY